MIKEFSREEMLHIWRDRAGYMGLNGVGVGVEYADGAEVDAVLLKDIRRWYAELLLTAPSHLLPIENVAGEATVTVVDDCLTRIEFPQRGVRLLGVRFGDSDREITTFYEPGSRQDMFYQSASVRENSRPIAVVSGRYVDIVGRSGGGLLTLRMVVTPKDDAFVFDESLLPRLIDEE